MKQNKQEEDEEKYISSKKERILDNLKISIEDVHIRYESLFDKIPFSIGFILNKVYTKNVYNNWENEIFVDQSDL